MISSQGLAHYNSLVTADRMAQFKNWATVWIQSSQQTSKGQQTTQPQASETPSSLEKAMLYQATHQKLKPRNRCNLMSLGGFIQLLKCLDTLEGEIFQEYSQTPSYVPPSKRLPFNPDRLSRKRTTNPYKRRSFASSTLVYLSLGSTVRIQPIQPIQDDDDDVPLGKLVFSGSKKPRCQ
jgi:hypothetical protein